MGFREIGKFRGAIGLVTRDQFFRKPVVFYDKVTFEWATNRIVIEDGVIHAGKIRLIDAGTVTDLSIAFGVGLDSGIFVPGTDLLGFVIDDIEIVRLGATTLIPVLDSTIDLGTSSLQFKDMHLDRLLVDQLRTGGGTESLPGMAFDGNANTGIMQNGANVVGLVTVGVNRVNISATRMTMQTFLNMGAGTGVVELTIVSGGVTATRSYHTIDTENDDASDSLTSIAGGTDGDILILRIASSSRTVQLRHNTSGVGRMELIGGLHIDLTTSSMFAMFVFSNDRWRQIGGNVP